MPYCNKCGNNQLFGVSSVPPVAPTANGPISGLYGDFDDDGQLMRVTRMGADKGTAMAAGAKPEEYFDMCLKCGSQDIRW